MDKKKIKKPLFGRIRNYFLTGAVVLIPLAFTLYLTLFVIKISTKILPKEINPNHYLPFDIPGIEIIISLFIITFIGWLSLSFLGNKIIDLVNSLLKKIPILRTIYSALGQMTESFTQNDKKKKSVVLFDYPRIGIWAVGFATKDIIGEISK